MIFRELIQKHTWPQIKKSFMYYFPQEKDKFPLYQAKFKKLKANKESLSNPKYKLYIHNEHNIYHIYTKTRTVKDLSLSLFSELDWLNIEIPSRLLKQYTESDIIALSLFDMCLYGFNQEEQTSYLKNITTPNIKE